MNKIFSEYAWEDYLLWQKEDKKILKKINTIIKDIERNGHQGIGKSEPLRHELTGYWSRRISEKDRFIYKVENDNIYIIGCKGHYD
jgi:toxin YoeB